MRKAKFVLENIPGWAYQLPGKSILLSDFILAGGYVKPDNWYCHPNIHQDLIIKLRLERDIQIKPTMSIDEQRKIAAVAVAQRAVSNEWKDPNEKLRKRLAERKRK